MPGQLRALRTHRGPVAQIVALGFPAAIAEAAALLVVAGVAVSTVDDGGGGDIELPLGISAGASAGALLGIAAALVVVSGLLRLLAVGVRARAATGFEVELRTRLAGAYIDAGHATQQQYRAGELLEVSGNSVSRAGNGVSATSEVALSVVNLAVLIVGAIVVAPVVGIGIVVLGATLLAVLRPISRRITVTARRHGDAAVEQSAAMSELAVSGRDIRIFGAGPAVGRAVDERFRRAAEHRRRSIVLQASAPVVYQVVGLLLVIGALALVNTGDGDDIAAFGGSALLMLRSLSYGQRLQTALNTSGEAEVYARQVGAGVDLLRSSSPSFGAEPFPERITIELQGVTYTYPDAPAGELALAGVDLTIGGAETVGIVGPSGSGKSTLADIVLRLRQPDRGCVRVGGTDGQAIAEGAWRRQVALVPQQVTVLSATVRDNIRFHRDAVTDEDVVRAARQAGLHDTIAALPAGYDTRLGDGERGLSGGQIQRVGIARALAGAPAILVLDEPTSALDPDSELVIRDTIAAIRSTAMVLVIAHRPSTLRACDRLVVVDQGRIVDDGPTAEVTARNAYVARLFTEDVG